MENDDPGPVPSESKPPTLQPTKAPRFVVLRQTSALPFLVIAALAASYVGFNRGYAVDDSYITFRYAQNALEGNGLVFNVGQRYYGSTAMGYAAALALIAKALSWLSFDVPVHVVSTLLSALSVASIAGICARLLVASADTAVARIVAAAVASLLVFVLPLSSDVASHETYPFVALLAGASYLALFTRAPYWSAALLVMAGTVRPDSLLFALILLSTLGLFSLVRPEQAPVPARVLLRAAGGYALGIGTWLLAMKFYYGRFLPGTLDAKKAQVLLGCFPSFDLETVTTHLDRLFAGKSWVALGVFAAIALVQLVRAAWPISRRTISPFGLFSAVWLTFAIGLYSAYSVFTVSLWPWYVVPIGFALVLAAVAGLAGTGAPSDPGSLSTTFDRYWAGAAVAFVVMAVVELRPPLSSLVRGFFTTRHENAHLESYDGIVHYLHRVEPQGTTIAISEPGTLGFKLGSRYQVYDVLGLASPGVATALLANDRNYAIRTWKPKYVVISWTGPYDPAIQPGFDTIYELLGQFKHPYWDWNIKRGAYLYRRKSGV